MGTQIPFEVEVINTGNAMDEATGIFTAPVKETYFFTFTGHAHFQGGAFSVLKTLSVNLYLNGNERNVFGWRDPRPTLSSESSDTSINVEPGSRRSSLDADSILDCRSNTV